MNVELIREFFMWMTVINFGIYIWTVVMCILLRNLITRMSGRMFGLSPEATNAAIYGYIGAYKILFIVFIFTPWLALLIVT